MTWIRQSIVADYHVFGQRREKIPDSAHKLVNLTS